MTTIKTKRRSMRSVRDLDQELPAAMHEYAANVHARLIKLEKEVDRTASSARWRLLHLLRNTNYQLDQLEERGQAAWKELERNCRAEAIRVLQRLESAINSAPKRRTRKTTAKRSASKNPASTARKTPAKTKNRGLAKHG